MSNELDPQIEQWYAYLNKGQSFYVTTVDEADKTIEVQHFDGDIEEFTFAEWRALDIELSDAPESWAGALDIGERDDLGTEITDTTQHDWNEPLEEFRTVSSEQRGFVPEESALDVDADETGQETAV